MQNEILSRSQGATTRQLSDAMLRSMVLNRLRAGDKLPTELELARHYGVSRPILRQALKVLEFSGIIESAPRRGTIAKKPDPGSLGSLFAAFIALGPPDPHGPPNEFAALAEARWLLERAIAAITVQRRRQEDLDAMLQAENRFAQAMQVYNEPARVAADLEFHRALTLAAHNPVFSCMVGIIEGYFNAISRDIPRVPANVPQWLKRNRDTQAEHRELRLALEKRDLKGLLKTLDAHLGRVIGQIAKAKRPVL